VDDGLADVIVKLNTCGYHTTASCEGHLEREEFKPYVTFAFFNVNQKDNFLELCKKLDITTKDNGPKTIFCSTELGPDWVKAHSVWIEGSDSNLENRANHNPITKLETKFAFQKSLYRIVAAAGENSVTLHALQQNSTENNSTKETSSHNQQSNQKTHSTLGDQFARAAELIQAIKHENDSTTAIKLIANVLEIFLALLTALTIHSVNNKTTSKLSHGGAS
jgi:hypothetical protein